jgi:protein phosphatase
MPDPAPNWKDFLEYAVRSDVGLRRSNNQDSVLIAEAGNELEWYRRGHLFMVADGMGAHAAGEMASKLACGGVSHKYFKLPDLSGPEALRRSIVETNADIHARGKANVEFQGMGTTCSVLTILPQGAVTGQVGDSRIYRLRQHRLEQLTFDHSLVWEMMAAGQLPKGETPSFIPKNIITRSLGPRAEVNADLEGPFPLEVGDTFMLCSDGLTGPVTDDEIGLMLDLLTPAEAVQALVDLANLRGGPDNISVIVVKIKQPIRLSDAGLPDRAADTGHGGGLSAVHPAIWIAAAFLGLAAVVTLAIGSTLAAIVCGAGALGAALVGGIKAMARGDQIDGAWANGRLGKGPHTARVCQPTAASVAPLAQLCEKLRAAAEEEKWPVDWSIFNANQRKGADALKAGNFKVAVREYSLAMSFLMAQISHRRSNKGQDSESVFGD